MLKNNVKGFVMKILFLLVPVFLFGEVTSDESFKCSQSNFEVCHSVGMKYLSRGSSDYNPSRSVSPLRKSCEFGKDKESCSALSSYYLSINDVSQYKNYLEKSCKFGDAYSCQLFSRLKEK